MMLAYLLASIGAVLCVLVVLFAYETLDLRREAEQLRRVVRTYERIDHLERQAVKRIRKRARRR